MENDPKSVVKDLCLLGIGAIAGVVPWLLDKAGYEMPRPVAVGCLVLCAVFVCLAISRLGWLEFIPFVGKRTVSVSSSVLAVVLVAGLVYGFGRIARPSYQPMAAAEMVQVIDKQFVNESVEVDGKNFVGCTFTGVRFIFRGRKEFRMAEGTFEGPVVIQTDGDESRFALAFVINMLRDLKMVKPTEVGFKDENLVIQKAPEPIKPQ